MSGRSQRLALVLFAVLALTLAFHDLGKLGLLDPDESRFAETSREMRERGDWVVPYFNGGPRLKKPPMINWAQIATASVIGESELSTRLMSALAYLGLLAAIVAFAWGRFGPSAALRAGAIFATIPLSFVCLRVGITDMLLTFFTTGALLVYAILDSERMRDSRPMPLPPRLPQLLRSLPQLIPQSVSSSRVWRLSPRAGSVLIGLFLGLAILTKGPVGLLAPVLVIAAFHAVQSEWSRLARPRGIAIAGGVALAVSLPWIAMVGSRVGFANFYNVVMRETVERYAGGGLEHPHGPLYYFAIMPLVTLPWAAFFIPVFVAGSGRALRRLSASKSSASELSASRAPASEETRIVRFLWIWIAAMLVFFSLSKGKLATYVLPLEPAVALYLAIEWERFRNGREGAWKTAVGLLTPIALATFMVAWWDKDHAAPFLRHSTPFLVLTAVSAGGVVLLSKRRHRAFAVPLLAVCLMGFHLFAMKIAGPELEEAKSLRQLANDLRLAERPEVALAQYHDFDPSLVFYARHFLVKIDTREEFEKFLATPGEAIVVMDDGRYESLAPEWKKLLRKIGSQGKKSAYERAAGAIEIE